MKGSGPRRDEGRAARKPVVPVPDAASLARVSPARRAAYEILHAVAATSSHSDDLLHGRAMAGLSEPDRNLATALVMGVLRWQIALDGRIAPLLNRAEAPARPVLLALRLGAFQLLHLDRVPAHAALSESVELCRAAGHPHAAGMVNAVLRKLSVAPAERRPIAETPAALAERLGHPLWLVERWIRHFGRSDAERITTADQAVPAPGGLFDRPSEDDPRLPSIDDGSRLVGELAAVAVPAVGGRAPRVWDCCAAPGGKTLVLAARLPGAEILATDASARRLESMRLRLEAAGYGTGTGRVRCAVADATELPSDEGLFDLILLDAPCSGTGTLARNPEIRLRLEPTELARQALRQRELLVAALGRVAPGGRLVYSTCSLEAEENEDVVASVSGMSRMLALGDLLGRVAGLHVSADSLLHRAPAGGDHLRTLPGVQRCDGFQAVVLEATPT